jgi:signal transduction histidine kinase
MSSAALEAGGADSSNVRLLLVDDHPPNLVDLHEILESPLYELVTARSAADALRELETSDFAVIIVSAEMSAIDGYDTTVKIKAIAPHIPILMLTDLAVDAARVTKAYGNGAVDLLHRSFGPGVVRAKVSVFVELYKARQRVERLTASLVQADQLQQQFLATLGEELRSPLNTILGWVRMLRDGTIRESQRGRALETVEQTASAQLELIQEMIDISRMNSGTLTLELGTVDFGQTVDLAVEAVRPVALAKQVTLHAALDSDVAPMSGDQERLRQVVQRLVSNAVECTPTEGLVTVSLSNVGGQVELAITDTGVGVDPQLLPRLFDPFVGDALKARAGGLGLAIVRHLVELHGGTICAKSAGPGLGCSFVVNMPAEGRTPRTDDEVR